MKGSTSDRNLLFGILALQLDFVTREQLIAAASVWIQDKDRLLDEILMDQDAMSGEQRDLIAPIVEQHVKAHGNEIENSLAAISSFDSSVREELAQLGDRDIEATLAHVPDRRTVDPGATQHVSLSEFENRAERFRVLRPHAKGGLGQVSVALDQELGREVALKEILPRHADSPERQARFIQEAEITGGLEHPGIVPIYGLGHYVDGRPFYAMRFIRGDSLKEAIERFHRSGHLKGRKSSERILEFRMLLRRFVDVCNAVDYAHSRGVLHRDLKPGNIMLGKYGETLLVDWGLAKTQQQKDDQQTDEPMLQLSEGSGSAPTQMGSAVGTPAYMSPEQAEGRLDLVGPASDVYSLGATLYCLLTGRPPFIDHDHEVVLRKVRQGEIPSARSIQSDIPIALDAICLRAMSLNQSERYASPRDLADDVEKWLADEPVSAYREPLSKRTVRWMRRHRTLVVSTASTVLVVTFALAAATAVLAAKNNELTVANTRADRNFRQAQATVDQFFTDVSQDQLLNEPGMQPLRARLLERAENHYETFLAESGDDPSVVRELAQAHFRMGGIQWDIGTNAEAIASFEKSLALTDELLVRNANDVDLLSLKARNLDSLGVLIKRTGDFEAATKRLEEALRIRKEIVRSNPDNEWSQRELARSFQVIGNIQLESGASELDSLNEALKILEPLAQQHPELSTHALIHRHLAEVYSEIAAKTADNDKAVELYGKAITIQRKLVDSFPYVFSYGEELGDLLFLLASRYRDGNPRKSEEVFRETIAIQEKLAAKNPDVKEFQTDLGWSCDQLGFVLQQQGRLDEAAQLLERARDIHLRLVESEPGEIVYEQRLATIFNGLALVQRDRNRLDESLAAFRGAIELQNSLVERSPAMVSLRLDLAGTHSNLSRMYQRFKRWDEAYEAERKALMIREAIVEQFPNRLNGIRWTAESWMSIAFIETMRQDTGEATQAYESAIDLFQVLVKADPGDPVFQSRMLSARLGLTITLIGTGDYQVAVEKADQLVSQNPGTGQEYNAACVFSLASAAARADDERSEDEQNELSERYATRAIELLQLFTQAGGFDSPQMRRTVESDSDLDAIRDRPEFRDLMSEINER